MRKILEIPAFALIALLSVFSACMPGGNEFADFRRLDDCGWAYGDTLVFIPEIADSVADGRMKVAVCHSNDYPYSNLWLEISIPMADGTISRDSTELILSDEYGHWNGSGLGTSFQLEYELPEKLRLRSGTPVSVRHIMRVDTLRGLQQIGLSFK